MSKKWAIKQLFKNLIFEKRKIEIFFSREIISKWS